MNYAAKQTQARRKTFKPGSRLVSALGIAGGVLLALGGSSSSAQTAIFEGDTLTIPYTAIMSDNPSFYSEVVLQTQSDGSMQVMDYQANPLVMVDEVVVTILESFPPQVQVTVRGNKSVPCVELLPEAISYSGNAFTVALAESVLGPAESCIAVLDPFELSISLDVADLPAGDYNVSVNGVTANFQL